MAWPLPSFRLLAALPVFSTVDCKVHPMPFDTPHNEAFAALGSLPPGLHWSAFDVAMDDARKGKAKLLVTSIWNYHSIITPNGTRQPTVLAICQDIQTGDYWYRISRPTVGTKRKTWVAHWNRVHLALEQKIQIVGVLKDVHTGNCSIENTFGCSDAREQTDGSALWLRLLPHNEIGCDVRQIDIEQLTSDSGSSTHEGTENELHEALQRSPEERLARLQNAPKFPESKTVPTTIWVRNYDVVAEALHLANGICEGCKQPAPFLRQSDGTPYLEVHHKVPLSVGGEDTLENTIALCPNCHRRAHYG